MVPVPRYVHATLEKLAIPPSSRPIASHITRSLLLSARPLRHHCDCRFPFSSKPTRSAQKEHRHTGVAPHPKRSLVSNSSRKMATATSTTTTTTTTNAQSGRLPVRAFVTHPATQEPKPAPVFKLENLELDTTLGDNELLVKITATGICHTDIGEAMRPGQERFVLGHEGAGIVQAVGSKVTKAQPGDMVMMSYISCRECIQCTSNPPHYGHCKDFLPVNFGGLKEPFARPDETKVRGGFFGQSSFSETSVVNEISVLNVQGLLDNPEELQVVAPLGCGLLTGYAAVQNVAKAGPSDRLIVTGLGGVGLAAIMAAKIAGCNKIIAVDRIASRLQIAKELGATDTIDTGVMPMEKLPEEVAKATSGLGASYAIDTTGVPGLMTASVEALTTGGELIVLGVAPDTATITFSPFLLVATAKTIKGSLMGDCEPGKMLPEIIKHYKQGRFPFDRLIKTYKPEDFQLALNDMKSGDAIKPVIIW